MAEIDAEMAELQSNLKELSKENEALLSYWNHNLLSQITGKQKNAVAQLEVNGDKAVAYMKQIEALRQRKNAITTNDQEQLTIQERVEGENQRRQLLVFQVDEAENRVAEIDKQLARERQSELQNEIDDINTLRNEYKTLIQTMLEYEKSKANHLQDKRKIAVLEGKFFDADKVANSRIYAKLQEAQRGTQDAVFRSESRGSWSLDTLTAMLGGGGSEAMRTANATEEMVRQNKQTNKLLKNMNSDVLVYG